MKSKLGLKFSATIIASVIVIFALYTALILNIFSRQYKLLIDEKAKSISKFILEPIKNQLNMTEGDLQSLSAFALDLKKTLEKNRELTTIEIIDPSGQILAHPDLQYIGKKIKPELIKILRSKRGEKIFYSDRVFHYFIPIVYPSRGTVAYLHLGFTTTFIKEGRRKIILQLIVVTILSVLILYFIVSFMVRRNIMDPITMLSEFASSVSRGDLTQQVNLQTEDELEELGNAYNKMVEGLRNLVTKVFLLSDEIHRLVFKTQEDFQNLKIRSDEQTNVLLEADKHLERIKSGTKQINDQIDDLFLTTQETNSSVMELGSTSEEIKNNMGKLTQAISEITAGIDEMAASINQVNNNLQKMVSDADEMTTSAAEISTSIEEVERITRHNSELSKEVTDNAMEGMESVKKTAEGVSKIKDSVTEIAKIIDRLQERSQQIGTITIVINQVAERTNLLALNASIIATQAGKHGRSFAVVAEQIRNLSQRVSSSTKEIEEIIKGIQGEINSAVNQVQTTLKDVVAEEELTQVAENSLKKILESSQKTLEMSEVIFQAIKEQTTGNKLIWEAAERITSTAHELAQAIEQQAASSSQIARATEEVGELSSMINQATKQQADSNKVIKESIEKINEALEMIGEMTKSYSLETEDVFEIIHRNLELIKENYQLMTDVSKQVENLQNKIKELVKDVRNFKV